MKVVMGVSEQVTVLDHGEKIAEGEPVEGAQRPARSSRPTSGSRGDALMALLEVDEIVTAYGSIEALKGVTLNVEEGEVVTLIGSNGAGKSTTLRSISGLTPPQVGLDPLPRRGDLDDAGAGDRPPGHLAVAGGPALLPAHDACARTWSSARTCAGTRTCAKDLDRVMELFPRLKERERQKAGTMSGGEQQMLAMGRALMADPTLLLLDEPSMGLAPILVDRIYETVAEINKQGTTILLVEQNANYALEVSARGYVLETGKVALSDNVVRAPRQPRSAEGVSRNMTVFGLIGATALWLTFAWLLSAIVGSYLSDRKGYGERPGLASGLLLNVLGDRRSG